MLVFSNCESQVRVTTSGVGEIKLGMNIQLVRKKMDLSGSSFFGKDISGIYNGVALTLTVNFQVKDHHTDTLVKSIEIFSNMIGPGGIKIGDDYFKVITNNTQYFMYISPTLDKVNFGDEIQPPTDMKDIRRRSRFITLQEDPDSDNRILFNIYNNKVESVKVTSGAIIAFDGPYSDNPGAD